MIPSSILRGQLLELVLPGHLHRRLLQLDLGLQQRVQGDLRRLRAGAHAAAQRGLRRHRREGHVLDSCKVSEVAWNSNTARTGITQPFDMPKNNI